MPGRSRLTIRLVRDGMSPDTLAWSDLRGFMDHFVKAMAALRPGTGVEKTIPIALTKGSVTIALDGPPSIIPAYRQIEKGTSAARTEEQRNAVREFFRFIQRAGWQVWGKARGAFRQLAVDADDTAEPRLMRGPTEMLCYVERIGGAEASVVVRDMSGKRHHFGVKPEILRALGGRIWERAVLSGTATWDAATGQMTTFDVTTVRDAPKVRLVRAFDNDHGKLPVELRVDDVAILIRSRREA